MPKYNIPKIAKKLRKEIDADRYHHTLGVMYTAASLAMCHGEDIEKAQLAGLLHDCAKCIPNDKKLRMCEKYGIEVTAIELAAPYLLHAKLGADLARRRYDVEEEDVLSAIRYHTTGRAEMTLLEKIVFIADYIEPGRWKASNLPQIRELAFHDLDAAVYHTLSDTLHYLHKAEATVDQTTQSAYDYYQEVMNSRK